MDFQNLKGVLSMGKKFLSLVFMLVICLSSLSVSLAADVVFSGTDDLTDLTKIFFVSQGLQIMTVEKPSDVPAGDITGIKKLDHDNIKYIVYKINGNYSIKYEYLYYSGDFTYAKNKVKASVSSDNKSFTPLSMTYKLLGEAATNFKRIEVVTSSTGTGLKYVKLEFDNSTANIWEPILVNVKTTAPVTAEPASITGYFKDDFANMNNVLESSSGIVTAKLDTNAGKSLVVYKSDMKILKRNTATATKEEYVIYKISGQPNVVIHYFTYDQDSGKHIKVYGSTNKTSWTALSANPAITRSTDNIWGYSRLGIKLSGTTKYLKLSITNIGGNAWDPLVDKLEFGVSASTINQINSLASSSSKSQVSIASSAAVSSAVSSEIIASSSVSSESVSTVSSENSTVSSDKPKTKKILVIDWPIMIGVILGILALALVLFFILYKKRAAKKTL
jgi:hypothetical protein